MVLLNTIGLCSSEYDFVFISFVLGYLYKSQSLIRVLFIEYSEILFLVFAGTPTIKSSLIVTEYPECEPLFADF